MLDTDSLDKQDIYKIMFQNLYGLYSSWFEFKDLIVMKYPEALKKEKYKKISEEVGSREARGLAKILDIKGDGLSALIQLLRCSHWAIFGHLEIEKLTEESFRMREIKCTTQNEAEKRWLAQYKCSEETFAYLSGFCNHVNPQIVIREVFQPSEDNSKSNNKNGSREWIISLEGAKSQLPSSR